MISETSKVPSVVDRESLELALGNGGSRVRQICAFEVSY